MRSSCCSGSHRKKLAGIQDLKEHRFAALGEVNDDGIHLLGVVDGVLANLIHQSVVFCVVLYFQYRPLLAGYIVTTQA